MKYAECDVDAIVAWRDRAVTAVANTTLQFVASVLVPGFVPEPIAVEDVATALSTNAFQGAP